MKTEKVFITIAVAAVIAVAANITGIEARENFRREYFGTVRDSVSFRPVTDTSAVADSSDTVGFATDSSDTVSFVSDTAGTASVADSTAADSSRAGAAPAPAYAPPVDSAKLMRDTLGIPMRDSIGRFIDTLGHSIDSLGRSLDSLGMPIPTGRVLSKAEIRMFRRDSIRAVKDSIIQNTPRILETYVIPDSLWYKRILLWTHDRDFNDIHMVGLDTTYNYHYYDLPFLKDDVDGIFLGVFGSPVMRTNYFKRETDEDARFFDYYIPYTYTPESLPMYNTKTPYVELQYTGTLLANRDKEEANVKVLATQNITPELNIMLEYKRFGGNGMLMNEDTDNRTAVISGNYIGKKYVMHAGYIFNRTKRTENGGLKDSRLIRDTMVEPREIAVWLNSASSETRKNTVFIDQSIRIPFGFIDRLKRKKREKASEAAALTDSTFATTDTTATAADTTLAMAADSTAAATGNALAATDNGIAVADSAETDSTVQIGVHEDVTTAFIGGIIQDTICSPPAFLIHRSAGDILHRRLYVFRIFLAAYKNAVRTGCHNHIL